MLQNQAGQRANTPTDNILESIRDALAGFRTPTDSTGGAVSIVLGPVFYIGTDFRFTSIAGGAKIEARNPATDTWLEIDRWTNP